MRTKFGEPLAAKSPSETLVAKCADSLALGGACDTQSANDSCVQEEYEARQADVSQTLGELRKYMDAIDDMQSELDERSSNNFGGIGPTSRARKAIADLKAELRQMDVKVGVARQQLLHMTLKKHVDAS